MIRTRRAALAQSGNRFSTRQTWNAFARRSCSSKKIMREPDSTQVNRALKAFRKSVRPGCAPRGLELGKGYARHDRDGPPGGTLDLICNTDRTRPVTID